MATPEEQQKVNPIKKRAKNLHRYFLKEDKPMINRYIKKGSLIIVEMQIKITMFNLISVRRAIIQKTKENKCW